MPALLTSAHGVAGQAARIRSAASGAVMSSSRSAPWRATVSTSAPSCASMRAVAAPTPRVAPVTTQSLPSRPRFNEMKSHTVYRTFQTEGRRELIRITEDVQSAVDDAAVSEGLALVAAMHVTAAVWINDDEPGLHEDVLEWLDKVAPPSWKEPSNDVARELLPDPGDYRHHRGGEDTGAAHLKNRLVHPQAVLPITDGKLDLGPWQAVFYCEFDGRRSKRLVIKVMGD